MFKQSLISKLVFSSLVIGLIFPLFVLGQPMEAPETPEEVKEVAQRGIKTIIRDLPGIIKEIWQNELWPIWQRLGHWIKQIWSDYVKQSLSDLWYLKIKPRIQSLIDQINSFLGREIEERKPQLKEEFEKEKEEMKEEIPKATESLWEKLKNLF